MIEATLLGTGSPVPLLERAGTAIHLSVGGDDLLVDCGPRAVYELMENGIDPGDVEDLLFTHHHVDHNADFFNFVISGWSVGGRHSLTLYGPPGTERLVEAMYDIYREDIEYRKKVGYPDEGIDDIDGRVVDEGFRLRRPGYEVTAFPVDHTIETYAYRVDETGDDGDKSGSFVFSGDTAVVDGLADFAAGADVLVQDCCMAPAGDGPEPDDPFIWEAYTDPMSEEKYERLSRGHCDPFEAGEIAQVAGVDHLVLTHLLPYRDTAAIGDRAATTFDGKVTVAEDGLTCRVP